MCIRDRYMLGESYDVETLVRTPILDDYTMNVADNNDDDYSEHTY